MQWVFTVMKADFDAPIGLNEPEQRNTGWLLVSQKTWQNVSWIIWVYRVFSFVCLFWIFCDTIQTCTQDASVLFFPLWLCLWVCFQEGQRLRHRSYKCPTFRSFLCNSYSVSQISITRPRCFLWKLCLGRTRNLPQHRRFLKPCLLKELVTL